MKFSVIIPIYNEELRLCKAVESVLTQTFNDFELILVNDGSTDSSLDICIRYQKSDSRIRIVNKNNGGLASARKAGAEIALGEYIYPLDADDWIELDTLENLYKILNEYTPDVILCGYTSENNGVSSKQCHEWEEGLYTKNDNNCVLYKNLFVNANNIHKKGIRCNLCTRLFKARLYKKWQMIVPDDIHNGEDDAAFFPIMLDSEKVYVSNDGFYHIVNNSSSLSNDVEKHSLKQNGLLEDFLRSIIKNNWPQYEQDLNYYIAIRLDEYKSRKLGVQTKKNVYLFPYNLLEYNSKIIIYGCGGIGNDFISQLEDNKYCTVLGIMDRNPSKSTVSINEISDIKFDKIVIAIKDKTNAREVINNIKKLGVLEEKILWCNYIKISINM